MSLKLNKNLRLIDWLFQQDGVPSLDPTMGFSSWCCPDFSPKTLGTDQNLQLKPESSTEIKLSKIPYNNTADLKTSSPIARDPEFGFRFRLSWYFGREPWNRSTRSWSKNTLNVSKHKKLLRQMVQNWFFVC